VRIGIGVRKKTIVGKKKDVVKSGIDTRITGTARSLSIAGSRTSSCPQLEITMNAMVMIGMTDPIDAITMMIGDLMGRLGGERPLMIGWGADSVCTIGLVIVLNIIPRNQEELEEMANARVPDEFIFCRYANTYRMESRERRRPSARQSPLPPWCPEGLTKT